MPRETPRVGERKVRLRMYQVDDDERTGRFREVTLEAFVICVLGSMRLSLLVFVTVSMQCMNDFRC